MAATAPGGPLAAVPVAERRGLFPERHQPRRGKVVAGGERDDQIDGQNRHRDELDPFASGPEEQLPLDAALIKRCPMFDRQKDLLPFGGGRRVLPHQRLGFSFLPGRPWRPTKAPLSDRNLTPSPLMRIYGQNFSITALGAQKGGHLDFRCQPSSADGHCLRPLGRALTKGKRPGGCRQRASSEAGRSGRRCGPTRPHSWPGRPRHLACRRWPGRASCPARIRLMRLRIACSPATSTSCASLPVPTRSQPYGSLPPTYPPHFAFRRRAD
jgi:hypothetical protein